MERLKGSLFISTKDIQVLNDCSIRQAQREHLAVRDALGINGDKLTVKAYCEYWQLDYQQVVEHINVFR